jgi:hypothetical protein
MKRVSTAQLIPTACRISCRTICRWPRKKCDDPRFLELQRRCGDQTEKSLRLSMDADPRRKLSQYRDPIFGKMSCSRRPLAAIRRVAWDPCAFLANAILVAGSICIDKCSETIAAEVSDCFSRYLPRKSDLQIMKLLETHSSHLTFKEMKN